MVGRTLPLLFALYFCQGLPGGFLAKALPAILRQEGLSLTAVGFAGLLSLPWTLKVVWAPLVDRFGHAGFGRRKSWLVPAQLGMLAITLVLAGVDPRQSLTTVALLFLVLNVFAATQDVAVDGLAVDLLQDQQLAPGNAAQVSGFKLGNLVGGGVLLSVTLWLGWSGAFGIMAALLLASLVMVLGFSEPPRPVVPTSLRQVLRTLWSALRRRGAWPWLFLVFAKFGETFGGAMTTSMLVDKGFSLPLIGVVDGTVGSLATIAGAALGGAVAWRRGWASLLALAATGQGLALVALGLYSMFPVTPVGYAIVGGLENASGGAVAVAVFHLAMSWREDGAAAAQFTVAQVVYMSGSLLASPLAGITAERVGYLPVMVAGGVMTLALAVLARGPARRLGADHGGRPLPKVPST
ncbi:MFS transporter [Paraliomyxa miuraensis]|uniref:MFS transporter n=1 Tax=Paraliomyxa miuraensis TaxID=376150 RepID=UPI00224F8D9A|nr:MFS transporter [Paraliomyxa miuraensis]MCX4245425.1 MFS transporter [Paraliomyxa miuraensis]